jgi:hypothetical protein
MKLHLSNEEVETAIKTFIKEKLEISSVEPVHVVLVDDTNSKLDDLVKSFVIELKK